ncbi:hypothetical protein G7046_g9086 [Stylonectria norvegica]|nr:hypothetical protein G7046_g9086 [Stylonectria norvegica]
MVYLNLLLAAASCWPAVALAGIDYPPIPADRSTPVQQRISMTGPNSMAISWNTYQQLSKPCVQYGVSSKYLNQKACSSNSVTYPTSRTWANTVTLTNLSPATTYYYKITSTNSTENFFQSPRAAGDKTAFAISAVIDLGVYGKDGYTIPKGKSKRDVIPKIQPELNHTTIGRLASTVADYEFVIHPGDLAYADDWALKPKNLLHGEQSYQSILEQFYDQLAPIAARKPYMVSPGNHEATCQEVPIVDLLCPQGQKNFTDFMSRFGQNMPTAFDSTSSDRAAKANAAKAKQLANPPFWFSFEYGMAHIVMIDTETDFPDAPDEPGGSASLNAGPFGFKGQQLEFLRADLASVDRKVTPWVVAAGHRPWYTTGGSGCQPCQKAFEEVFYEYGVDLGVFGHVHNSQRFVPVFNNTVDPGGMHNPKAPMYIVAGGAGNVEGLSDVGSNISSNAFAYADDFSYATISFLDANNLAVNFIRSSTGEVLDRSNLYKSHSSRQAAKGAIEVSIDECTRCSNHHCLGLLVPSQHWRMFEAPKQQRTQRPCISIVVWSLVASVNEHQLGRAAVLPCRLKHRVPIFDVTVLHTKFGKLSNAANQVEKLCHGEWQVCVAVTCTNENCPMASSHRPTPTGTNEQDSTTLVEIMSEQDEGFLAAVQEARDGFEEGGVPIGACLVSKDGKILGKGHNQRVQKGSATLHAEISALENSGRLPASAYEGATMYTTLSPCIMCTGACLLYKIKQVVIGENKTFLGGEELLEQRGVEVVVLENAECESLMQSFIAQKPQVWKEDIGE